MTRIPRTLLTGVPTGAWTRRGFLATALASGVVVACGGGNDAASTTADEPADGTDDTDTYTLVQRFPQGVQVPGPLRLPISLSTGAAELIQDGPASLDAQVISIDGDRIGPRLSARRRDVEPAPYYDFRPTIDKAGVYFLVVDGGPPEGASFDVADPASVVVPRVGQPLAPFDTPTSDDARGVDPICTRAPEPCPFHEVTLSEALAAGTPVVYYVGTPEFCSTGSCSPAIESLVELYPQFGDRFTFVHAEVYIDDTATTVAPAVDAVGLFYEPALFVTDATGTIVERLDAVWNTEELAEALERALS